MAGKTQTQKEKEFHVEVIKQTLTLSTAGFGLAAALAWNSLIQEFINTYVKKFIPGGEKVISMFIYAVAVTVLAVAITYYLSRVASRLNEKE